MLLALSGVLAVTAGCNGPDNDGPPAPEGPRTAAERIAALGLVPGESSTATQVTGVTERFAAVMGAAVNAPERGVPGDLPAVATGEALTSSTHQIEFMRDNQLIARGRAELGLRYLGTTEGAAYVGDCTPNGQVVVHHGHSGAKAENIDPGLAVTLYRLHPESSGWKVAGLESFTEERCPF